MSNEKWVIFYIDSDHFVDVNKMVFLGASSLVSVIRKGQRPGFIIAQPTGLGICGKTPCGLKASVILNGVMTRAFSPHGILIS